MVVIVRLMALLLWQMAVVVFTPVHIRVRVVVAQAMAVGMAVMVLLISVQEAAAQGDTLVLAAVVVVYGQTAIAVVVEQLAGAGVAPIIMVQRPDQVAAV
jgi:hypothetical protein